MPKLNFTVRALQALLTPINGRVEYWDLSTNGSFGLRISSTGQRSWVVMYRAGQRLRRFTIGDYERVPLAEARALAKDVLYRASKGQDPATDKKRSREAETFADVATEYIERHAKVNKRSWSADERMLTADVLPYWASLKAGEIRRRDVIALLDKHVARGAPILANRVLALVRKIFNFGIERDILEFNPCQAVKRPVDERSRQGQRVLTFDEIRKLWRALESSRHKEVAAILQLRLLTLQRGVEIRLMEWNEFDLESGWWTIPGNRTKNKLDHRISITGMAWDIISRFKHNRESSKYVFTSPTNKSKAILNLKDPFKEIFAASGIEKRFVMRDLRRTSTSHMTGQLSIPRFTVGKILNHVESGVTKVYDRHSYDLEKRESIEAWSRFLNQLISSDGTQSNLIRLNVS